MEKVDKNWQPLHRCPLEALIMDGVLTLKAELRVWQDERLGKLWRVAYRDGDDETVVSFPDAEALGDFIAEQFGLDLFDLSETELALAA